MAVNKKKLKVDEVTDEQGRRRFHGAFTGGFSAGYYNTAGSAEGWAPSTFKSSRSSRASSSRQRAQDYMDAEDGLFSSSLERSEEYDTFGNKINKKVAAGAAALATGSIIPGPAPSEFIVASTKAIGKRLLATMGWKEGQGLGPRLRSKRTSIVPAGVNLSAIPAAATVNGVVTLAPENTRKDIVVPVAKSDMHGIGYVRSSLRGFAAADEDGPGRGVYRMDAALLAKGGSSTAAAAGSFLRDSAGFALGDDVDDVYDDGASMPRTGSRLVEEVPLDPFDGDGPRSKRGGALDRFVGEAIGDSATVARCPSDNRVVLEGFILASAPREDPEMFPPLIVPSDFKGRHVFPEDKKEGGRVAGGRYERQSLEKRSKLLAEGSAIETPVPGSISSQLIDSDTSVFSLLDERGREKIKAALQKKEAMETGSRAAVGIGSTAGLRQVSEIREQSGSAGSAAPAYRPMLVNPSVSASVFSGVSAAFKSRFATASTSSDPAGSDQAREGLPPPAVGLWRIEKKPKEEGDNSGILSATAPAPAPPAPASMVSKPTGVGVGASMRITTVWQPHPLLCKRMSVPVPAVSKDIAPYGQPPTGQQQSLGDMVGAGDLDARFRSESKNFETKPTTRREDELYEKHIGQHLLPDSTVQFAKSQSKLQSEGPTGGTAEEEEFVKPKEKPPKSLFKSIFEPDDSSDGSSSDDSDSEDANDTKSTVGAAAKGPSLPAPEAATERDSTADVSELPTASLPAKIFFRKPANTGGAMSSRQPKALPGLGADPMDVEATQRMTGIKRGPGALSFADDVEAVSAVSQTKASRFSSSESQDFPASAATKVETSDSSSSDSSSGSSDSDNDESKPLSGQFSGPSSALLLNVDANKIKEKLRGLIEKSSKDKKKKKSSSKRDKKEKKEKKSKKHSKKHEKESGHRSSREKPVSAKKKKKSNRKDSV